MAASSVLHSAALSVHPEELQSEQAEELQSSPPPEELQ